MCLYPRLIKNRKYVPNKKNGGNVPTATDPRVLLVPVGCQKCIECRKQKARAWQARLTEEIQTTKNGHFVTLTFSTESLIELENAIQPEIYNIATRNRIPKSITGYELDNEIATLAVRRFLERWRKKYKTSVKHWLITEIGGKNTEGIHLHGIIFTNHNQDIETIWKYGYTFIGQYVNEVTVNYIIKYVHKVDKKHTEYTPKILTSKGIGNQYFTKINSRINKYQDQDTDERYQTRRGLKINLPIYYRNGIYTEEQREKLWLEKLNKQIRWVCGEKIDISTPEGELAYHNLVKYYRAKNKRLGYGNDEKNWNKIRYENDQRKLKMAIRVKKEITRKPSGGEPSGK